MPTIADKYFAFKATLDEAISANTNWREHIDKTKDAPTAALGDLEWADAIIFSAPTRYGSIT